MSKLYISLLIVVVLFAVPVAVFVMPDAEKLENERRRAAAFPKAPSNLRAETVKIFFKDLDAFFADRFPLRASLLDLSVAMYEAAGDNLDMDKCYRGRENWLFVGNHYNRCMDKLQGKAALSDRRLRQQTEEYGSIRDTAESLGAEFFILIGANKSSIYPEYLPPTVTPARRRFAAPLLDSLREAGIRLYDPTDRLTRAKAGGLLYWRTDSHWNYRGAHEAFEGFRQYAGLPALPPLFFTEAATHRGDLIHIAGYKDFLLSPGDNFTLHWNVPFPPPHGKDDLISLITNTHAVSEKTVWVFGDSFAGALMPYIKAMFKEVRLFRHVDFATAVSSKFSRPDMVLWVQVERAFANAD